MYNFINNFNNMSILNGLVLSVFILISYLIITDDRFTFNRKIIILISFGLLGIISIYIDKAPYDIIKDLFWYSLVINGSFIFHTLILDRAFYYCWKNHYEYIGFIISRLSYILSLEALNYIITEIVGFLMFFFHDFYTLHYYKEYKEEKENKEEKKDIWIYYCIFYVNYIQNNLLITTIFDLIKRFLVNLRTVTGAITATLSLMFHNYSLLIMGLEKKDWNLKLIINYILQFSILLLISWIIGYPRLYIVWLLQILIECYKIFNFEYFPRLGERERYQKLSFRDKIIRFTKGIKQHGYLYDYSRKKQDLLNKIFLKPYHPYFMVEIYLHNTGEWGGKLSKYNTWEDFAYNYIKSKDLYWKEFADNYSEEPYSIRPHEDRVEDIEMWLDSINRKGDKVLFNKLLNIDISNENYEDFRQKFHK